MTDAAPYQQYTSTAEMHAATPSTLWPGEVDVSLGAIISISACTTDENSFVYTQINSPIGEIDPIFGFPYRQYTSTTEMTDAAPYQQYTSTAEMTDAPQSSASDN